MAENCNVCQQHKIDTTREPLLSHEVPERVWDKVGIDHFHFNGNDYLICCCYTSNYWDVERVENKSCQTAIKVLKRWFSKWGIPRFLFSDNSPFNSNEMAKFADSWGFTQVFSSPMFPSSNGKIERSVRTVKNLMQKARDSNSDVYKALLEFRVTPTETTKVSPAQMFYGRNLRGILPTTTNNLRNTDKVKFDTARQALIDSKQRQAHYHDRHARVRPGFTVGDTVRIRDRPDSSDWRLARIARKLPYRSYDVELPDHSQRRRTSKHVRWSPETFVHVEPPDDDPPVAVNQTRHSETKQHSNDITASADRVSVTSTPPETATPRSPTSTRRDVHKANNNPTMTRSGRTVRLPQRYRE